MEGVLRVKALSNHRGITESPPCAINYEENKNSQRTYSDRWVKKNTDHPWNLSVAHGASKREEQGAETKTVR
jgi:hypothetical protein